MSLCFRPDVRMKKIYHENKCGNLYALSTLSTISHILPGFCSLIWVKNQPKVRLRIEIEIKYKKKTLKTEI